MSKKQTSLSVSMRLCNSCNENENDNGQIDHINQRQIYKTQRVSVRQHLDVISTIYVTFQAQFNKKLSKTVAEMKKTGAYKIHVYWVQCENIYNILDFAMVLPNVLGWVNTAPIVKPCTNHTREMYFTQILQHSYKNTLHNFFLTSDVIGVAATSICMLFIRHNLT